MLRKNILYFVIITALVFMVSCSGGGADIVTPPAQTDGDVASDANGTTACFGLWQVTADKATGNVDVVQLRSADKIINVLGFMEPPPFTSMDLDWPDLNIDFVNGTLDVGIILTHPIPDGTFTGFDVRGVCFGPEVTNADGLTIIPSPQFFKGVPFGYMDGLLGAPDSHADYEGLAGYKYFCDGIGEDEHLSDFFSNAANIADRGKFSAGSTIQRNYNLDWNDVNHNFLVFNYAIYANYDWPTGSEPWDVDDFPIATANSAEAFCCKVDEAGNSLYYSITGGGGAISLQVEVWDWQGNIKNVSIESYGSSALPKTYHNNVWVNGGEYTTYVYEFDNVAGNPTTTGDLDILITVNDVSTFDQCWFLDLLPATNVKYGKHIYNCWLHTTDIPECPAPHEISIIDPPGHHNDGAQFPATVYGIGFVDGDDLGVVLKKNGEPDIVAANVNFVDDTQITCDITIPTSAATGPRDVEVTNGCGTPDTGYDLFEVYGSILWNPSVSLLGSNTKCRATGVSPIPDTHSTYDSSSSFNVSGSNATGGLGSYTYEYYISTSNIGPTGSPVGWVPFAFDNGGTFTVQWVDYSSLAPDRVYVWVHATDGSASSVPVKCLSTMMLSRASLQTNTFNSGWYVSGGSGPYVYMYSNYFRIRRGYSNYVGKYISRSASAVQLAGNNSFEFYIPTTWYNQYEPDGSYVQMRHGASYNPLTTIVSIDYKTGSAGTIRSSSFDYTGNRYIGFYAFQTVYQYDYNFYISHVAIYNNPA